MTQETYRNYRSCDGRGPAEGSRNLRRGDRTSPDVVRGHDPRGPRREPGKESVGGVPGVCEGSTVDKRPFTTKGPHKESGSRCRATKDLCLTGSISKESELYMFCFTW